MTLGQGTAVDKGLEAAGWARSVAVGALEQEALLLGERVQDELDGDRCEQQTHDSRNDFHGEWVEPGGRHSTCDAHE